MMKWLVEVSEMTGWNEVTDGSEFVKWTEGLDEMKCLCEVSELAVIKWSQVKKSEVTEVTDWNEVEEKTKKQ